MYEKGDVVVVKFLFVEGKAVKVRPALILGKGERYDDYIIMAISSIIPKTILEDVMYVVDERKEYFKHTGLVSSSVVLIDKLATLNEKDILRKIGAFSQNIMVHIEKLFVNFLLKETLPDTEQELRGVTHCLTENFYKRIHAPKKFISGKTYIPYAGRVYDEKEMVSLVDSAFDFWLTTGRYADEFEQKFANFLGIKYCSLCNSGSSANLLAFMALTSHKLGDRKIQRGDEVITVAAGFPTTVAPIIQYGAIPVFVDITLPTYNIDCSHLELALSPKTKAVMIAHTLGNPFDVVKVKDFCNKYNLWLIEDNCDALGSRYFYDGKWQYTGTFGDLATSSFYPPHHITMGEGGAVYTNDLELHRIINSLRDWGRDCWCPSGHDNTCKRRFQWQLGELPQGYDHKYTYSHFGFNLKVTDMQAAIGCAQLDKLPSFIEARKRNWKMLREGLDDLTDVFVLPEPTANSEPSWFGFLMTVREDAGFPRDEIVKYLELHNIQTRMLFAGNMIRHPCFDELRKTTEGFRVVGELKNTDKVMRDTFWVGVYPGMTEEMIGYIIDKIKEFACK